MPRTSKRRTSRRPTRNEGRRKLGKLFKGEERAFSVGYVMRPAPMFDEHGRLTKPQRPRVADDPRLQRATTDEREAASWMEELRREYPEEQLYVGDFARPKRRVTPNAIPPPPSLWGQQHQSGPDVSWRWVERTYAIGTPVRLRKMYLGLPAGLKGTVDEHVQSQWGIRVRWLPGYQVPADRRSEAFRYLDPTDAARIWSLLEPLDDNWAQHQTYTKRSYKMQPNVIPPPPSTPRSWDQWLTTTFADGTRVRAIAPIDGVLMSDRSVGMTVPVGAVGKVTHRMNMSGGASCFVFARFDVLDPHSFLGTRQTVEAAVFCDWHRGRQGAAALLTSLEPLDDNWGRLIVPSQKRYGRPAPNSGRDVRAGVDRMLIELIDAAEEQDWTVTRTERGHLRFLSPDRAMPPVILPVSRRGEPRQYQNARAILRRHGLLV